MAGYFPKIIFLLPHIALLVILFVTYVIRYPSNSSPQPAWKPSEAREGSSEWFANLQAIQNLMGF